MPLNLPVIVHTILEEYALAPNGAHGVAHWARVMVNGLRLAEVTGANVEVVQLFAIFHDSRRAMEARDPQHGSLAAAFATDLRGQVFELPDHELSLLCQACIGHTHKRTHSDITIQTCWDADRLDLGRVGVTPVPNRLCTEAARDPAMISWADSRSRFGIVPQFVKDEWGITLERR